jgi:hypothetical protein
MGELSNYFINREIEEHMDGPFDHHTMEEPKIRSFIWWVQGDGTRIKVESMTDTHLMNSINMIDRRSGWRKQWKEPLMKELEKRKR